VLIFDWRVVRDSEGESSIDTRPVNDDSTITDHQSPIAAPVD
jgi:hypothetical protein